MASESGLYVTTAAPPARGAGAPARRPHSLAALALLALMLAHWGWIWFGPQPIFIAAPAPETDLARRAAGSHFFGTAGAVPDAAPAGADLGDVRLLGVFAERDGKGYALVRAGTRAAMLVAAGQDIASGLRVESVRPDGVSCFKAGYDTSSSCVRRLPRERPRVAVAAARPPPAQRRPASRGRSCV